MSHKTPDDQRPNELLTVREVARALSVSDETIRRRVDDGTLRSIRLGTVRRVFASELDRLCREPEPSP